MNVHTDALVSGIDCLGVICVSEIVYLSDGAITAVSNSLVVEHLLIRE